MKIKCPSLLIALILNVFFNVFAQTQDQNYIKNTEYLETVLVDSEFNSSFGGWLPKGSVDLSLDNGRIKANINSQWEGVEHLLNGFVTKTGDVLNVKITFDKGNTQSDVRIYFIETDPNGNQVAYRVLDYNMQTGTHYYNHTMLTSGNSMSLRVDKTDTNTSSNTYFFIDYISLKQGGGNNSIKKLENVTYFDGFGKAKQTIGIKQTPNQKDVLQHVEYDEFGRTSKQYLAIPTSQSSGNYISNPVSQITNYYQTTFSDQHPFSESRFDNSPLNRVLETSSSGDAWELLPNSDADHTTKFYRGVNASDEVYQFDINEGNSTTPLEISYYQEGQLLKNIVKNVNYHSSDGLRNTKEIFTDKNGRKIAEFSYEIENGISKKLSTYYVYDDNGNLKYVLTPKIFESVTDASQVNSSEYHNWQEFVNNPTSGGGGVNITVQNNTLTINFDAGFNSTTIKLSQPIVSIPSLPNLNVNNFDSFLSFRRDNGTIVTDGIAAHVENGYLYFSNNYGGSYLYENFNNQTISVSLNDPDVTVGLLNFSQQNLDDLAFQYKYDQFNRQIEQKIPGKDWEYMVYDQLDRPILTQDANLRAENEWLFNKYDVFGRVVYSGIYTNNATRDVLQTQADNFITSSNTNKSNIESRRTTILSIGGVSLNYTNNAFPNSNLETLNVSYFDDYNFTDSNMPNIPSTILGQDVTNRTKGLITATWTKVLETTNTWSKNYTFYDNKGRIIYVDQENHLGGYTKNKSKLDFRGKVEQSITAHKRQLSSNPLNIEDNFEYDHVERPTKHFQKINSQTEELISNNEYNELGQLESKKVGGSNSNGAGLQTIDYTYNIKGWLTKLNDVNNLGTDLFAYSLKHEDAIEGSAASDPMYNGNIRQAIWKSAKNNTKKGYVYAYDKLNRLERTYYREGNTLTSGAGKFETYSLKYDSNGNISRLSRNGRTGSQMDKLGYTYDKGNKLLSISDRTNNTTGFNDGYTPPPFSLLQDDYYYDTNGNLTKDLNKDIALIEYNYLDLVKRVTFGNGNKIEFTYDANGSKLQMKNIISGGNTTTIDYLGGFQYTNTQLKFFPTAEGYVAKDGNAYKYVYVFSDHLGNNRLSYHDTNNDNGVSIAEILSNTDYYAMGLIHNRQYVSGYASNFNYKFQGKEQLEFENYNMYDFGSRMYDASVGRWFNTDPQNQFQSPYLAMGNNWVMSVDPNGEFVLSAIAIGAIIGAATAAVTYSIPALAAGNWNLKDFGTSVAFGAVTGAITAGLASAGSSLAGSAIANGGTGAFWQSATFNVLSNTASQVGAGLAFGDPISAGTLIGSVAGGLVSSRLPEWQAIKGGYFTNAVGELLNNTVRGTISGGVSGNIGALVDGDDVNQRTLNGARNGAVGSFSQTLGMIAAFGSTRQLNAKESKYITLIQNKYNFNGSYNVRRGGIYQLLTDRAVTWGNNIAASNGTKAGTYGHEYGHIYQFYTQGWAQFQGKGLKEALLDIFSNIDPYIDPKYNEKKAELRNNSVGGRMHGN